MAANLVKKWLVVQIKRNSNSLAIRNLERQGFVTYLPKMNVTTIKQKRFIYKNVLVFPGYMFVGVDPQNSNWTRINSTYGVSKVLVFNNKPCEISIDLILVLKNRYNENINPITKENLKKGDNIRFDSGPFVDLIARIEALDENNRIWVILEAMGGHRKLKLERTEKQNFTKI